jgi:methylmalonyl-CoA mutase cobalamin-binding subunit
MSRDHRKHLIELLEIERASRVLTYVTSDRQPASAQIGEDALRPIFDVLATIGHADKLDLFIYSRGGALEVPWRIASTLRGASNGWDILVPFRANSAATLLALGADRIVLGRHGELGPIDPILNVTKAGPNETTPAQDTINVEDVMAYLRFAREEAGLSDQDALAGSLKTLTDRLDAVGLGSVYRTRTHIRDVARRMLTSRKEGLTERAIDTIIETLAEKVYAHGHAIGFGEAKEIGLSVERPSPRVEDLMWELLEAYEDQMKMRHVLDPIAAVANTDPYSEEVTIAAVESSDSGFQFDGTIQVRAKRQIPANLNVALNVGLQLPPGIDVAELPTAVQQLLQQGQQALAQLAQQAVQQAITQQAPVIGCEFGIRDGQWRNNATPDTNEVMPATRPTEIIETPDVVSETGEGQPATNS